MESHNDIQGAPAAGGAPQPTPQAQAPAEPTFEELAERVALRSDGAPLLSLPDPPDTLTGRLSRLGMLALVVGGLLLGVGYTGFFWYDVTHPFVSETHEADLEYLQRHAEETERFTPPPEPLMQLPRAELVRNEYNPSDRTVTIKLEYVSRESVPVVGQYFARRWEAQSEMIVVADGNMMAYNVIGYKKTGGMTLSADIALEPRRPGVTRVKVEMQRAPTPRERRAFRKPDFIPEPPPGAIMSTLGGGAPGTEMGRIYQVVVPAGLDATLDYYRRAFREQSWQLMGEHTDEESKSLTYIYRRGSRSLSVQVSPLLMNSRQQVIVDLVPF